MCSDFWSPWRSQSPRAAEATRTTSVGLPGSATEQCRPPQTCCVTTFRSRHDQHRSRLSEQWQQARALVDKFPASQGLIDEALADLAGEGLDFETDIRPALGSDVTIAVLDVSDAAPTVLILTPADPAQLDALLAKSQSEDTDNAGVWRVVGDSYVVADDDATIDAALNGAEQASLASNDRFKGVMEALPGDSLARVWISPTVADEALAQAAAETETIAGLSAIESVVGLGAGTFEGAGVALLTTADGIQLVGISKTTDAPLSDSGGKAEIVELAPAGVLAYASLRDLRTSIDEILKIALAEQPDADQQIAQAEAFLGVTIENDLLPLFENEHAVYVRPGVPLPEVTVVLSPDDPEAATKLVKKLAGLAGLSGLDLELDTIDIGDISVERLIFNGTAVYIGEIEGRLVLTTSEDGISDFGGENSLKDDPRFAEASSAAGLPDETSAFAFLDIPRILEFVTLGGLLGAIDADGADLDALRNLDPLGAMIIYTTVSADEQRFAGFLAIE